MCGCMETWLLSWENNDNNNINFIFSRIWEYLGANIRGTQQEHNSKPLKHSIVKRMLVFKR